MRDVIETDRMVLRPFAVGDAALLIDLDSDPEVMRFLNGGRPTPHELVEREILPRFRAHFDRYPGFGPWAARHARSGEFLGWFNLRCSDDTPPGQAELGYRLRRDAWGCGYATEGSRELIRIGFTELGLDRITANTMTVNTRSRRVMEKSGLRLVRTFFEEWPETIEGSESGDVEYAISRAEWLP
jgi:RimJ/RimL family protein N-acetyltransferase